jgi:hypothetical protein
MFLGKGGKEFEGRIGKKVPWAREDERWEGGKSFEVVMDRRR